MPHSPITINIHYYFSSTVRLKSTARTDDQTDPSTVVCLPKFDHRPLKDPFVSNIHAAQGSLKPIVIEFGNMCIDLHVQLEDCSVTVNAIGEDPSVHEVKIIDCD
ncbi:hypothetical protein CDAR_474681 [Caerostris darwini]|uniref:Uncharacterized protein n=1 Tax=Caerostris darwini TaxID=1538125 RepID=A0AAV4UZC2_9ARAC|nr:hypothetical protein CDAR_474681 [Caerostris darwini]